MAPGGSSPGMRGHTGHRRPHSCAAPHPGDRGRGHSLASSRGSQQLWPQHRAHDKHPSVLPPSPAAVHSDGCPVPHSDGSCNAVTSPAGPPEYSARGPGGAGEPGTAQLQGGDSSAERAQDQHPAGRNTGTETLSPREQQPDTPTQAGGPGLPTAPAPAQRPTHCLNPSHHPLTPGSALQEMLDRAGGHPVPTGDPETFSLAFVQSLSSWQTLEDV